ncbi:MAG TPA: VOC family protein [Acidimicrobiales bacterium]
MDLGNSASTHLHFAEVETCPMGRLKDICFDCRDPWTLAHWWAETLGYRVRPHSDADLAQLRADGIDRREDDPNIAVDPIDEKGPGFWFCRVPEPKVVKNRVHVDVMGDVDELVGRGASVVDRLAKWTVLADPEGNEFCVFERGSHPED